jgi:uncharacterized membrane protein
VADVSDGIRKLRTAMLIYFVAFILIIIGYVAGFSQVVSSTAALGGSHPSTIMLYLGLFIAGFVISIITLIYMRSGFSILASANSKYGLGKIGALLQMIGAIFFIIAAGLFISSLVAAASTSSTSAIAALGTGIAGTFASAGLYAVGAILSFVGVIMLVVAFFRIGSEYNNTAIKVGAIFYILFAVIGVILLYVGLGSALRQKQQVSVPPSQPGRS